MQAARQCVQRTSLSIRVKLPSFSSKFFSNLTLQKLLTAVGVGMLDAGQARDHIFNEAHCAANPEFEICLACFFSKLIDAAMIN